MKLMKNGRLFGKLNVIDLIVILLVVAVAAAFIVKRSGAVENAALSGAKQEEISYSVLCRMVPIGLLPEAEKEVGNQLMSNGEMIESCFVESVEKVPYYELYVDADGEMQKAESEEYCSLLFTIGGTAPYLDNAYQLGSQEVRVGKSHIVKTKTIELTGTVISMEGIDG